jgi:excisionase family DNA binding protein
MKTEKLLYSRLEAAKMLSVSQVTLWRLVCRGELQPQYIGSRQLFSRTELEKFAGVSA